MKSLLQRARKIISEHPIVYRGPRGKSIPAATRRLILDLVAELYKSMRTKPR